MLRQRGGGASSGLGALLAGHAPAPLEGVLFDYSANYAQTSPPPEPVVCADAR